MRLIAVDRQGQEAPIYIDRALNIGEGATASVYKVNFKGEFWAAKIYKPDRSFDEQKLEAMLQSPPDDMVKCDGAKQFLQYTWVTYLLRANDGRLVGFLMPFVDQESTNSLDTYYDPVLIKRLSGNAYTALSLRLEIAVNLCDLLSNLHSLGHHFIDIKPQNIRVYKENNKIVLMDCDGYSISDPRSPGRRYPADLISTDFIAPEVLKNNLSPRVLGEDQDRYGLAVLLFQLLNQGTHPFQGIVTDPRIHVSTNDERAALWLYPYGMNPNPSVTPRSQSVHDLFLTETRVLFDGAFTTLDRPSASTWSSHFKNILDRRDLVRCKVHPHDFRHIHFRGFGCIGCKIEGDIKKSKEGKTSKKPGVQDTRPSTGAPSAPSGQPTRSHYPPAQPAIGGPTSDRWGFYGIALAVLFVGGLVVFNRIVEEQNHAVSGAPTSSVGGNSALSQKYAAAYVSYQSRAVGYSFNSPTKFQAEELALAECRKVATTRNTDQCTLIASGQGLCIAVSQAPNGAVGIHISDSATNAADVAVSVCRQNGGGSSCSNALQATRCGN